MLDFNPLQSHVLNRRQWLEGNKLHFARRFVYQQNGTTAIALMMARPKHIITITNHFLTFARQVGYFFDEVRFSDVILAFTK